MRRIPEKKISSARPRCHAACAPQKGAGGGMAALNSSLDNGDRDAATDEARRIFFEKMQQRTAWPAAEAAPPDAEKEEG